MSLRCLRDEDMIGWYPKCSGLCIHTSHISFYKGKAVNELVTYLTMIGFWVKNLHPKHKNLYKLPVITSTQNIKTASKRVAITAVIFCLKF